MNSVFRIILALLVIFYATSSFAQYEKVDLSNLDYEERAKTYSFAFNMYSAKNLNELPSVNTETASPYFLRKYEELTYDYLGNAVYFEHYGDIKKMKLHEVLSDKKKNHIYRYKVSYTESDLFGEIRMVVDKNGKFEATHRNYFWSDKVFEWGESIPIYEVNIDSINQSVLDSNKDFILKSFNKTCVDSEMYPLNIDNTTSFARKNFIESLILEDCKFVKENYGELTFLNLYKVNSDSLISINYEYKALFESTKDTMEISVQTDLKNRFSKLSFGRKLGAFFFDGRELKNMENKIIENYIQGNKKE